MEDDLHAQIAERDASLLALKEKTKAFVNNMKAQLEAEKQKRAGLQAQLSEAAAEVSKADLRAQSAEAAVAAARADGAAECDALRSTLGAEAKTNEAAAEQMATELEKAREAAAGTTGDGEAAALRARVQEMELAEVAAQSEVGALRTQLAEAQAQASQALAAAEASAREHSIEGEQLQRQLAQAGASQSDNKVKTRAFVEALTSAKAAAEDRAKQLETDLASAKLQSTTTAGELTRASEALQAEKSGRQRHEALLHAQRAEAERRLEEMSRSLRASEEALQQRQSTFESGVATRATELAVHKERRAAAKSEAQKLAAALEVQQACFTEVTRTAQQLFVPHVGAANEAVASLLENVGRVLALYVPEDRSKSAQPGAAGAAQARQAGGGAGLGGTGSPPHSPTTVRAHGAMPDTPGLHNPMNDTALRSSLAEQEDLDTLDEVMAQYMPVSLSKGRAGDVTELALEIDALSAKLDLLGAKLEQMVTAMRDEDESQRSFACFGAKFICLFTSRAQANRPQRKRRKLFKRKESTRARRYQQLGTIDRVGQL
jgi:hypothetical protein